jgi:hypothetical protein
MMEGTSGDPITIKAIMIDVDGVLIVRPDRGGLSGTLKRDLGIPGTTLKAAFFEQHGDNMIPGGRPAALWMARTVSTPFCPTTGRAACPLSAHCGHSPSVRKYAEPDGGRKG